MHELRKCGHTQFDIAEVIEVLRLATFRNSDLLGSSPNQNVSPLTSEHAPENAASLKRTILGAGIVRMFGMVATFGVGVQLARYLGPKGVGIYGTVLSTMAVGSVVAQLGLPQLLTREIAVHATDGGGRIKGAIASFLIAIAVSSILGMAIGFLLLNVWHTVPTEFSRACLWGLPLIPLLAMTNLAIGGIRGAGKESAAQFYDAVLRPVLSVVGMFIAYQLLPKINPVNTIQIQGAVVAIGVVTAFIALARYLPRSVFRSRATRHSHQWSQSAGHMAGTEILRIVDGNYPVLLMGAIATDAEAGVLRVALAMAAMIGVVSSLVNVAVMPRAAALFSNGNRDKLQELAATSAATTLLVACVATVGVLLIGRTAILVVFGESFLSAWLVLLIFSLAYCVNGFFGSTASILNMSGHEYFVTRAYFVGLIVGVIVTYGFYGLCGITAAGVGLLVSEVVKGLMLWVHAGRQLHVDTSALAFVLKRKQLNPDACQTHLSPPTK
jgi:O-antigen/teichoic acid export membrane protein